MSWCSFLYTCCVFCYFNIILLYSTAIQPLPRSLLVVIAVSVLSVAANYELFYHSPQCSTTKIKDVTQFNVTFSPTNLCFYKQQVHNKWWNGKRNPSGSNDHVASCVHPSQNLVGYSQMVEIKAALKSPSSKRGVKSNSLWYALHNRFQRFEDEGNSDATLTLTHSLVLKKRRYFNQGHVYFFKTFFLSQYFYFFISMLEVWYIARLQYACLTLCVIITRSVRRDASSWSSRLRRW